MRDFNSCVARAVKRFTPEYEGGGLWARRYSQEFLPGNDDIEEYFFYMVLQPVKDGLVPRISDYPGYNCFHDAVYGIERAFKVVNWTTYNAEKRYNPQASIKDHTEVVNLKYSRLPGYEHLSQKEYAKLMHEKLEERRVTIVKERLSKGLGFIGRKALLKMKRGALPKNSKTSTIDSHRPRILCVCDERRAHWKAWYFECYFDYKEASYEYRNGNLSVTFPEGMFKPYCHPLPT